ncbi:hypothetical protein ELG68_04205 [Rhizobium leguminosarum]|nr:hypothetical protein ELG85_04115 [Rhizobium leguminosarum]TBG67116.1 hypothetical protein ELG74_04220 [Rhizobium leguminosarum]TBH10409.1 hypothetical protein ELG68_04205 [Rhizobium leguminosarum]
MKMRLMGFPFAVAWRASVKQLSLGCSMRELGCGFPCSQVRIHGCLVCEGCPFVLVAAPHPNPLPVKTGRGDVPYETRERDGEVAAYPLRPASGEKVAAAG